MSDINHEEWVRRQHAVNEALIADGRAKAIMALTQGKDDWAFAEIRALLEVQAADRMLDEL